MASWHCGTLTSPGGSAANTFIGTVFISRERHLPACTQRDGQKNPLSLTNGMFRYETVNREASQFDTSEAEWKTKRLVRCEETSNEGDYYLHGKYSKDMRATTSCNRLEDGSEGENQLER